MSNPLSVCRRLRRHAALRCASRFAAGFLAVLLGSVAPSVAASEQAAPRPVAGESSNQPLLTVQVLDENGEVLPHARVFVLDADWGLPMTDAWFEADGTGALAISRDQLDHHTDEIPAALKLVVGAAGRAWWTGAVSLEGESPAQAITVPKGDTAHVAIKASEGATLPRDVRPLIYPADLKVAAWANGVDALSTVAPEMFDAAALFSAAHVTRRNDGRFRFQLPEGDGPFFIMVSRPGFLRGWESRPLQRDELLKGDVELELPEPATLVLDVQPSEEGPAEYAGCTAQVAAVVPIGGGGWTFDARSVSSDGRSMQRVIDDLAPGQYYVTAGSGEGDAFGDRSRVDFVQERESAMLSAGEVTEFAFTLETFDEARWRERLAGDHALEIKVIASNGEPAAGTPYELRYELNRWSTSIPVAEGELGEDGAIVAHDLGGVGVPDVNLQLYLDGEYAGWFQLTDEEKRVVKEIRLSPAPGDPAPDVMLTRLDNGRTFRLSDYRGQWIYLDFWATWCGRCQEPMAHANEVWERRADDWEGKVVIIGASVDDHIETLRKHVEPREWTKIIQAFCSEGEAGWNNDASKAYAIKGVPTAFLIDPQGKVEWTGHPVNFELEAEIDKRLEDSEGEA